MGLLERFKKRGKGQTKSTYSDRKEENVETCANDGRRYTILVEDTFQLLHNRGIIIAGVVHGTVAVGDAAYIMQPNGQITLSKIDGIEVGPKQLAKQAKDQHAGIWLASIKEKTEVAKYSVITSIRPQSVIDVNQAVENAQLLGMSMEYNKFYQDSKYGTLLVYEICHAHFIAPVYMEEEPRDNGDGTAAFTKDTKLGLVSLNDPEDSSMHYQPIFTDWKALQLWKGFFDEQHPRKTIVLSFPDVVTIAKNMNGAVVNPFGPVPIRLTNEFIEEIISMDGYQDEFVNGKKEGKEVRLKKDTHIMIGIPAENDEVKMVRETVIAVSKYEMAISKVYMLLKMDEENEQSYFLIIDCDKERKQELFDKIGGAIKPYLNRVKYVDMMTLEQYGDRLGELAQKSLVYDRKY